MNPHGHKCVLIRKVEMSSWILTMLHCVLTSACKPTRCLITWTPYLATCLIPLLLAGCGSLPRINPDLAMHRSHPIQMEGARGPLSNQQSKAILTRLKLGVDNTNIFDRHLAMAQEVGGSPLAVGNKVELLIDGPATYASMFAALSAAKDHINMETFLLEPDEIGQSLVAALLIKQHARGAGQPDL